MVNLAGSKSRYNFRIIKGKSMLKICHFSDLHLSEKTKDEGIKILKFIFDYCRKHQVHAIINSGDTFDGPVMLGDDGPVNELVKLLHMTPAPMYSIEGTKSHDKPGSIDIFNEFRPIGYKYYFYTYRRPESFEIVNTGDKVILGDDMLGQIHPDWNLDEKDAKPCGHLSVLPTPTKSFLAQDYKGSPEGLNQYLQEKLRDILAEFGAKAADSPKPHILIAHITVTGSEASTGQVMLGGDMMVSVADLSLAKADYIALGHIHKAQQPSLPRHISYAGSPYHLNFGELEPKGFKIVTFDDNGNLADIEFIETPSRPRQVIDVRIEDGHLIWNEKVCKGADVRIRIYGTQHELEASDWKSQAEYCASDALANSIKIETIPQAENRIRSAEITQAKTLREKLTEYGKVKLIDIPESALRKADELEGMIE